MEGSTVNFHGKSYRVNRVLNDRPIAIVLDVSRGKNKRRIIKIYPAPLHRGLYKNGFKNELLAYKTFREQGCTFVPLILGSTITLTVEYPEGANVPDPCRLEGNQRAIMLEYLDGEMLQPCNATVDATTKALQYLKEIHRLSICHGDVYTFGSRDGTPRNVMILNNGDVRWIDFEHSEKGGNAEELEEEQKLVEELIGPNGRIWQTRK